jgi:Cd2+/Zn2+-exporting ATPase
MTDDHTDSETTRRQSPWLTPFAKRTYAAGVLWAAGLLAGYLSPTESHPGWLAIRLDAAGILYTLASAVGGLNFFGSGLRAVRTLKLDMNFLMSAAIVAAILIGEPFEAATLAFLFSFAELLERYAVDRGRRSIARLVELAPEKADRITGGGTIEEVEVHALKVGDKIRVRPGDKIPADGKVITGASAVNESTITGESLPVGKQPGDAVFAGTLNLEGSLDIEVTVEASHSTIARIVQLVRQAEMNRAPVEEFVKKFARIYTPIVTVVAVGVMTVPPLLGGQGLEWFTRGLTLLVIACPCALAIATPVTVVSALTSAARHGVLIKGGQHLEALGQTRALAIDKTGTLTTGQLSVTSLRVSDEKQLRPLLERVASLEARSEHPIAAAIVRYAAERGIHPDLGLGTFEALLGKGIRGRFGGEEFLVGTEELVGAEIAAQWGAAESGSIQVFVSSSTGGSGVFLLADRLRPSSPAVIDRLHQLGVKPIVMVTGDGESAAQKIARMAGVDEVFFRLLPEEKVAIVQKMRAEHGSVAMMGDGVNDAPALAAATVGIVMGAAGSPAAIETADVALMADDLDKLPYAFQLSRKARRTIRFNIGLALGLKLVLAVGAVLGMVSLAVAVLVGDMGGALVVTANALRVAALKAQPK